MANRALASRPPLATQASLCALAGDRDRRRRHAVGIADARGGKSYVFTHQEDFMSRVFLLSGAEPRCVAEQATSGRVIKRVQGRI
mgnify:CR=1 FL=1